VALKAAQESERLKSEFLATTSHELRTPLNAILNAPMAVLDSLHRETVWVCSQCKERFARDPAAASGPEELCVSCQEGTLEPREQTSSSLTPDDIVPLMQAIISSGRHLLGIIDNVLELCRLEAGRANSHFAEVSVAGVVDSCRATLDALARPKKIHLDVELPDSRVKVHADPTQLRQMITNLVDNAIKFSGEGQRVEIGCQVEDESVRLLVCDQGIGIAAEDQASIFESFRQVHTGSTRFFGGTGLGLAIAKRLAEAHRGTITVESEVGRGATFCIHLPLLGSSGWEAGGGASA
jgi:signal transduction histidine kinase